MLSETYVNRIEIWEVAHDFHSASGRAVAEVQPFPQL